MVRVSLKPKRSKPRISLQTERRSSPTQEATDKLGPPPSAAFSAERTACRGAVSLFPYLFLRPSTSAGGSSAEAEPDPHPSGHPSAKRRRAKRRSRAALARRARLHASKTNEKTWETEQTSFGRQPGKTGATAPYPIFSPGIPVVFWLTHLAYWSFGAFGFLPTNPGIPVPG